MRTVDVASDIPFSYYSVVVNRRGDVDVAIPDLNTQGLLPPGLYDCTLNEVRDKFGRFKGTEQRQSLFEKLSAFIHDATQTGMVKSIIIDGSFVTSKDSPADIDLVLEMQLAHNPGTDLRPFEYNVLSKRVVKRLYGFDLFLAGSGSKALAEWVEYFHQVKPKFPGNFIAFVS